MKSFKRYIIASCILISIISLDYCKRKWKVYRYEVIFKFGLKNTDNMSYKQQNHLVKKCWKIMKKRFEYSNLDYYDLKIKRKKNEIITKMKGVEYLQFNFREIKDLFLIKGDISFYIAKVDDFKSLSKKQKRMKLVVPYIWNNKIIYNIIIFKDTKIAFNKDNFPNLHIDTSIQISKNVNERVNNYFKKIPQSLKDKHIIAFSLDDKYCKIMKYKKIERISDRHDDDTNYWLESEYISVDKKKITLDSKYDLLFDLFRHIITFADAEPYPVELKLIDMKINEREITKDDFK